ncbi:flavin reductase [Pseudoxanthomonas kalamensis DSM 18571]|uniref:flavin reductase family protein n=1 Tax=Pseudoxanthomonas kalamensis TaxID=289483 RepID=UPI0013917D89|nr:flavin reductase family protein [Pseudoxanthomonas kalamensis]KAF1709349.1 flavin reductase [Pseudoxanthomonas kalamensis DSM 18571]
MANRSKQDYPVSEVRRYIEPGPILLVTSQWQGERDVMTLGWHTVMEFVPSLVGCMISGGNHSHELIRRSGECVLNLPTADIVDTVSRIGNCSGTEVDKFSAFGLQTEAASRVKPPLLSQCHASFECVLHDDALVDAYNFFVFRVVKAHVAPSPKSPQTLHYLGDGEFMLSGKHISRKRLFTKVS